MSEMLHSDVLVIGCGIAGGTASGKTTMTNTIVRTVGPSRVVIIAYDLSLIHI